MEQSMLYWALVLILGFPLLTIVLGEGIERFKRQGNPLAKFLRNIRTLLLPPLAIIWVMRHILGIVDSESSLEKVKHIPWTDMSVKIVETFFWVAVIYVLVSLIDIVFTPKAKQNSRQIQIPNLFFQVARALVILIIGSYVLANIWNVNLGELSKALGIGSLVIALALQDTLSNLVSGFLLLFESPFKEGDWLRIGNLEGEVIEMNWRAVRLKTNDRDIVIIPNGILGQESICNYTMIDPLHAERVFVRFSYDELPNNVKRILKSTALTQEEIVSDPEPDVRTKSYDDFAITYEIKFYIKDFTKKDRIRNELMTSIYYAAKRNNLNIPYPIQEEIKVEVGDVYGEESQQEIVEFLSSLSYLIYLEPKTIDRLGKEATLKYYGTGETILKEGEFFEEFYIILKGRVILSVKDISGGQQEVATLGRGDFFGEILLLSGQTSRTSVKVMEDLTAIAIQADSVIELSQRNGKFTFEMNQFIEERRKAVRKLQGMENILNKHTAKNGLGNSILERLVNNDQ